MTIKLDDQADDNNNEYDTACSDSEDGDDDGKQKKLSTQKDTMRYTKMQNKNWNKMFRQLISYKNQHNSTSVPRIY